MRSFRQLLSRYSLFFFFSLAFLFTWANWVTQVLSERGIIETTVPGFVVIIAGYGPALAAILVTGITRGRDGLRWLFSSLFRWRVGLRWYLAALLIPPAIHIGALLLHLLFSSAPLLIDNTVALPFAADGLSLWGQAGMLFAIFMLGFDGLGEELGWRGFALPRLQEKRSALVSSLILGFFWALWHLPYMLSAGSALADRPLPLFFLNVIGISIVYTWLYNNTRGSTLLAILFHAAGNTTGTLLAGLLPAFNHPQVYIFSTVINWLAAIVLLLSSRGMRDDFVISQTILRGEFYDKYHR